MACSDFVYAEDTLDYIIGSYRGDNYVMETYEPDCYVRLDAFQGIIYKREEKRDSNTIWQYGFGAVPNVYGLMSQVALEESGIFSLRRQPYLDLYGQGVMIGLVDTGVDFTHEAFINADGSSRIVALWDQTIQDGQGTEQFPYGREFTQEDLSLALTMEDPFLAVPSRDEVGHGTFLSGVAAGNEMPEKNFSGVAPLAELAVVKCKEAKQAYRDYYGVPEGVHVYQENDILAGIAFLMKTAERRNRPVVIFLGMGTNMGSHDGGTSLSAFMERYNRVTGVTMMVCAGNEGNTRHHHWIARKNDMMDISVQEKIPGFMCQIWWRTPGGLTIGLTSPGGQIYKEIKAVKGERRSFRFSAERSTVEVLFGESQEFSREQVVVLRFVDAAPGIWKITVNSDFDAPNFHAWLPIQNFLPQDVIFLDSNPDSTINSAGTATYVTAVSAYDPVSKSLYAPSGRGFTPTGIIKPEIVAPGVNISGPVKGNRYGTMTGTSVATAIGAGVAALFMQNYEEENLNGIGVREVFIRGAMPRGVPYPNTEWGFGILQAERSVNGY